MAQKMRILVDIKAVPDEWEQNPGTLLTYSRDTWNTMNLEQVLKEILPALAQINPNYSGVVITVKLVKAE